MTQAAQQRLTDPGPKRILALDGGGVRGIVSIAFLERIERLLAEETGRGDDFRLSDYFDLIGGTSVGSMLATMLAMGDSVAEVRERFERWAPEIFRGRETLIGVKTFDARQHEPYSRRHRRPDAAGHRPAEDRPRHRHQAGGHRRGLGAVQQSEAEILE
jgi:predicted acylesterase/phospholipase RssA